MKRSAYIAVLIAASAGAAACGGPGAPAKAPSGSGEIDLSRPHAARAEWPAGLVPCSRDAAPGESCAARPTPPGGSMGNGPSVASEANDDTVWNVPIADAPVRGPADALVTLVVFSDFECPFCRKSAAVFEQLLKEYPTDVRLVWKDLPLPMHAHAEAAAELARFARAEKGDAGFWAAHDLLYAAQPDLSDPALKRVATELGLQWGAASSSIRNARFGGPIRADVSLSDRVDVQATPTTFVNGRKLVGAQPYERTRALVDRELTRARDLVRAGVPRKDVYGQTVSGGKQVSPPSDVAHP